MTNPLRLLRRLFLPSIPTTEQYLTKLERQQQQLLLDAELEEAKAQQNLLYWQEWRQMLNRRRAATLQQIDQFKAGQTTLTFNSRSD